MVGYAARDSGRPANAALSAIIAGYAARRVGTAGAVCVIGLYGSFVVLGPNEQWDPEHNRILLLGNAPDGPGVSPAVTQIETFGQEVETWR